ncbi:hypothetical protein HZA38_00580 [Candidatus Peregrinibacteria bacterium]|nr:hypothetical protein [Candidatus Peregrinibacteria bacterium]
MAHQQDSSTKPAANTEVLKEQSSPAVVDQEVLENTDKVAQQIETSETLPPEQYAAEVREQIEKTPEKPSTYQRVEKFVTTQVDTMMSDFEKGDYAKGSIKLAVMFGAGILVAKGLKAIYIEAKGVVGWFTESVLGIKEGSEGGILGSIVKGLLVTTGLGALGITGGALIEAMRGKVTLSEVLAAAAKGPIAFLKLIYDKGIALPPEVWNYVAAKVAGAAGIGEKAEQAIEDLLKDPSFTKALTAAKAQLEGILGPFGIEFDFLKNITEKDIVDSVTELEGTLGIDKLKAALQGNSVVIAGKTISSEMMKLGGAVGVGFILFLIGRTLLSPTKLAKLGISVAKHLPLALGVYFGLKALGIEIPIADDIVPKEIQDAVKIIDAPEILKDVLEFLKSGEIQVTIGKFLQYLKEHIEMLREDAKEIPFLGNFLPLDAESLNNLNPISLITLMCKGGLKSNEFQEALVGFGEGILSVGTVIFLLKKIGLRKAVWKGMGAFLLYCLYKDYQRIQKKISDQDNAELQEAFGDDENYTLLYKFGVTIVGKSVEQLHAWQVNLCADILSKLKANPKTSHLVEKIDALEKEKGFQPFSVKWIQGFYEIIAEENKKGLELRVVLSETGMAIIGNGFGVMCNTTSDVVGLLYHVAIAQDIGAEEAVCQYGGIAAPFMVLGGVFHGGHAMGFGVAMGFAVPAYITVKAGKFALNVGKGVVHASELIAQRGEVVDQVGKELRDIPEKFLRKLPLGKKILANEGIIDLMELYAKRASIKKSIGINTAKLDTVYEKLVNEAKRRGIEGMPSTMGKAIEEIREGEYPFGASKIHYSKPLDIAEIFEGKNPQQLSESLETARRVASKDVAEKFSAIGEARAIETFQAGGLTSRFSPIDFETIKKLDPKKETKELIEGFRRATAQVEGEFAGMNQIFKKNSASIQGLANEAEKTKYLEELKQDISTFLGRRERQLTELEAIWKKIPRGLRRGGLRNQYKFAVEGARGGIALEAKEIVRGKLRFSIGLAGVMMAVRAFSEYKNNPEEELLSIFQRLGPEALQLVVDVAPITGTLSMGYNVIYGKERFTGRDVGRLSSLGWGIVNLLSDAGTIAALVGSAGTASAAVPLEMGGKIALLATKGGRAAETAAKIMKEWGPIKKIIETKGVGKFLEEAGKFLKAGKGTMAEGLEKRAFRTGLAVTAASIALPYGYSYLFDTDAPVPEEIAKEILEEKSSGQEDVSLEAESSEALVPETPSSAPFGRILPN